MQYKKKQKNLKRYNKLSLIRTELYPPAIEGQFLLFGVEFIESGPLVAQLP